MTDDVFKGNSDNQPPATPVAPVVDPSIALLGAIQNADGTPKYKTVEAALSALGTSQSHIAVLETENATMKDLAARTTSMEDLIAKMQETKPEPLVPAAATPTSVQAPLTEDQMMKLIRSVNTADASQAHVQTNHDTFNATLRSQFGEKATDEFLVKQKASGFTMERVKQLAGENPAGTLQLLGFNNLTTTKALPTSTLSTPAPAGTSELDLSQFKTVKEKFAASAAATRARLAKDNQ